MNISELLGLIDGAKDQDTDHTTKTASSASSDQLATDSNDDEKTLEAIIEEAFVKAAADASGKKQDPPASPEEMIENTEDELTEEDILAIANAAGEMDEAAGNATEQAKEGIKAQILQAGAAVVEDALQELSESQRVKVAYVASQFKDESRAKLFTKLAAKRLASNYRIVQDMDFARYFTEDGKPKSQGDGGGDKVNEA